MTTKKQELPLGHSFFPWPGASNPVCYVQIGVWRGQPIRCGNTELAHKPREAHEPKVEPQEVAEGWFKCGCKYTSSSGNEFSHIYCSEHAPEVFKVHTIQDLRALVTTLVEALEEVLRLFHRDAFTDRTYHERVMAQANAERALQKAKLKGKAGR